MNLGCKDNKNAQMHHICIMVGALVTPNCEKSPQFFDDLQGFSFVLVCSIEDPYLFYQYFLVYHFTLWG